MSNIKTSRLWGSKKKGSKGTPGVICGFCRQPIAQDKTHSGKFYSVSKMEGVPEEPGGAGVKIHTVGYCNTLHDLCLVFVFVQCAGSPVRCDAGAGIVKNLVEYVNCLDVSQLTLLYDSLIIRSITPSPQSVPSFDCGPTYIDYGEEGLNYRFQASQHAYSHD